MSQPIPSPEAASSTRATHLAWVLAAVVGGVCGVLVNRQLVNAPFGMSTVALGSLFALPLLFGVLGPLISLDGAVRRSMALSMICLLVSTPLLGEGVLCLVIIAPWHLAITPLVALVVTPFVRRHRLGRWSRLGLLLFAFGGAAAAPLLDARLADPDVRETYADTIVIDAPPEVVWASIERLHLDFATPAPWVVQALPRPLAIRGGGASVGSERRVIFDNGVVLARVTASDPPRSFEVALSVEQSGREFFDHWSDLETSRFVFEALPDGRTAVTHSTTYRPLAWPRWYFAPAERALGSVLQRHMLEAYAAELFPQEPALTAALP